MRDLPDLRGLSAREALRVLTNDRIDGAAQWERRGDEPAPCAGTPIEPGMACVLRLERTPGRRRVGGCGAMNLAALPGIDIRGLAYDSRQVRPGDVFIALKGLKAAGADFAAEAVRRGAVAVVADRPSHGTVPVPWVIVPDARAAMAAMAVEFYGHPSRSMQVVGITGTNGKTTTAYLLRAVLEAAGKKCGLLGTVAYSLGDQELPAARTTPEAPDVQRMFRQMVDAGCGACVMEVSSHALALRRVDGTAFAAGVFTNLTRDHLDYHGDMESYFAAKRRLFDMLPPGAPGVINLDDPRGESLRKNAVHPGDVRDQQGRRRDSRTAGADVRGPRVRRPHAEGRRTRQIEACRPPERVEHSRDRGDRPRRSTFRLRRSSAASPASAACPDGSNWCRAADDDITVVIDYAHTDDALKNLLETARPLAAAPRHHRVRLWRRSRSDEAATDGRGCRQAERRRRR